MPAESSWICGGNAGLSWAKPGVQEIACWLVQGVFQKSIGLCLMEDGVKLTFHT